MSHLSLFPSTGSQLQLASSSRHRCLHIEQQQAQHPPTTTPLWQSTSPQEVWDLQTSDASSMAPITERHKINLQNVFIHRSWLVEWTSHPHPECWIPDNFQATPENSSLPSSLDFIIKKKKKPSLSFLNFAVFPLTSPCLASICSEQCLELCITSTSCVCLPFYNTLLIVFLNCKSFCIKASAKWINVNVRSLEFVEVSVNLTFDLDVLVKNVKSILLLNACFLYSLWTK